MNGPDKAEWDVGELLISSQKVFVLWAVKVRFCVRLGDFINHYGPDFPIADLVDALEQGGFLRQSAGELVLTETGDQAVACLGDHELSPYAVDRYGQQIHQDESPLHRTILLGDHDQARVWEMRPILIKHFEAEVEAVSSFEELDAYLEPSVPDFVFVADDLLYSETLPPQKGKRLNRLHSTHLAELLNRNPGIKFCLIPSSHSMMHLVSKHSNLFFSASHYYRFSHFSVSDWVDAKALHL